MYCLQISDKECGLYALYFLYCTSRGVSVEYYVDENDFHDLFRRHVLATFLVYAPQRIPVLERGTFNKEFCDYVEST